MLLLSRLRTGGFINALETTSQYLINTTNHFFEYNSRLVFHTQNRYSSIKSVAKNHYFIYGLKSQPQEDKKPNDHVISSFVSNSVVALAEGQEKWTEEGVNPIEYPRTFCRNLSEYLKEDPSFYITNLKQLIRHTAGKTTVDGSCTVCALALDPKEAIMRAAYLGNVGYSVLRRSPNNMLEHLYQSQEQLKMIDTPLQIGKYGDNPNSVTDEITEIEHNDIIVVGSSTIFSNLTEEQICACIRPFADSNSGDLLDAELVAEIISDTAFKFSNDTEYASPYQKKVAKYFQKYQGGKKGDIEVIVCQVKLK